MRFVTGKPTSFKLNSLSYEAYVLYIFMKLLVLYSGGEPSLASHLTRKRYLPHMWPLNKFLTPVRLSGGAFLLRVKQGVLQFVLIKPQTALLALILDRYGLYAEGDFSLSSGYAYISFINNLSVSVSLYSLGLFYLAT